MKTKKYIISIDIDETDVIEKTITAKTISEVKLKALKLWKKTIKDIPEAEYFYMTVYDKETEEEVYEKEKGFSGRAL